MDYAAEKRKKHKKYKTGKIVLFAVLLVVGVINLYPMFYALLGSLSSEQEIADTLFLPIPAQFWRHFDNYAILFTSALFIRTILLTLGKIVLFTLITGFISVLAGYVFAKIDFVGKQVFFIVLMSSMMIPGVALIVPNYIWMARFPLLGGNNILGQGGSGLINNPVFVFITGWVNVYNIFLCRQAFVSLGDEMAESAEMDGANFFHVVFRIYFPLILPVLAVIFLNLFIGNWNDYMTNLVYMPGNSKWYTVGNSFVNVMNLFSDPYRPGGVRLAVTFATALLSMIPPVIVYVFVQKQFAEGLTLGAVKG